MKVRLVCAEDAGIVLTGEMIVVGYGKPNERHVMKVQLDGQVFLTKPDGDSFPMVTILDLKRSAKGNWVDDFAGYNWHVSLMGAA